MKRTLGFLVLTALVLLSAAGTPAGQEIKLQRATLADIRSTLFGHPPAQPGLIVRGAPFEATFERVTLSAQDVAQLMSLLQDVTTLPARSEVKIEGTIDRSRFKAKIEKNRRGFMDVTIDGLTFADQQQMLTFLASLTKGGATQCKLRGYVGDKRVEVKLAL